MGIEKRKMTIQSFLFERGVTQYPCLSPRGGYLTDAAIHPHAYHLEETVWPTWQSSLIILFILLVVVVRALWY